MGDGIMFFYGAPDQSPHQARDAVTAVLAIRKAVERFNREVAPARNWPPLGMRCGVSTGNMIVGDAGHTTNPSEIRADYTVLGDNVNLGSRLEAANKAVGTGALVAERTWELSRDAGILFRPVGKLCVVGKKTGVMTYEPMALLDDATEQQKALASATKAVVGCSSDLKTRKPAAGGDSLDSAARRTLRVCCDRRVTSKRDVEP